MKLKNIITKVICMLLAVTMVVPAFAFAAEEEKPWDSDYAHSSNVMPFTPSDSYVSEQNPPDFKWGYVEGATYELIVARDAELKDVVYNKADLNYNYLSIDTTLETGIPLYWACRYKDASGNLSTWSTVRRFRIDPDAYEYVVPDIKQVVANVPTGHPRLWINPDELEDYRSYKDAGANSKKTYDYYMKQAENLLAAHLIEPEPVRLTQADFATSDEYWAYFSTIRSQCEGNNNRAIIMAYAYLLSGNPEFGRFAIELTHSYTTWDAVEGLSSHKAQDQVNRIIMLYSAFVYDWCYDLMTEQEKQDILDMILIRREQVDYLLTSLDKSPYNSHGWTIYSMMGTVAYALLHDVPEAEAWLEKILTGYTCFLPVWSYQDGGWCQGTGYARHSRHRFLQIGRVFKNAGVDLFGKAWMRNSYLWYLYAQPFDSVGSFGDEGGIEGNEANYRMVDENPEQMFFMPDDEENGVRKWVAEMAGGINTNRPTAFYSSTVYDKIEAEAPTDYQLSHEFNDLGWICMTNDLTDPNRILATFKSSPYGSYNHSHADQNAFFIEAFGEPIATYSGYYATYGSPHHFKITNSTAAHNTITVATNRGQKIQDMSADGSITGYLTQQDFDLAMGDATPAYKGGLAKFERAMIYVRPDLFVVVDDLKASSSNGNKFEWWLNTPSKMEVYESGRGAKAIKDGVILDAEVQYPEKVTTYYTDIHAGSDMVEVLPYASHADKEVQKRVWFETERVMNTKMIVTLDPHRETVNAKNIDTEYFDEYVKMTFENGAVVVVNLTEDNTQITTKDGITFDGLAAAYNDESIMLVGGTILRQGETDLIILEKRGSVVVGKDELSISTCEDNRVSLNVNNPYVSGVTAVTDYDGRELSEAIGITYERGKLAITGEEASSEYEVKEDADYVTFTAWQDNYQLMLNGKLITSTPVYSKALIVIDGVETEIPLSGHTRRDGANSYVTDHVIPAGKYKILEVSDDLNVNLTAPGTIMTFQGKMRLSTTSDEVQKVVLESVPIIDYPVQTVTDYDMVKSGLTIFNEAENYDPSTSNGMNVYTSRTFLSGGAGVSKMDTEGYYAGYNIEIEEEGDYLFAVKYVAFTAGGAVRYFTIDGKVYSMFLAETAGYGSTPGEWVVAQGTTPVHLTPGTYNIKFEPVSGQWNYDWFGFIKQ